MKKVAIYGQSYSISAEKEIQILLQILNENGSNCFIEKKFYELLKKENVLEKDYETFTNFDDLNSTFDVMFTLGGDGTILRAVTYIRNLNIPILGINTGRLGFLATINKDTIKESIDLVIKGEYRIQERTVLSVKITPQTDEFSELNFALNEITIARKNTTSMIGIKTSLNFEYLTNYWADGLIIATPTGSTGYSLSCNGPVISPDSKNLVITPIAPHNLNARPMVISDETNIQLSIDSREKDFLISLDSRITTVPKNTEIFIEKAPFTIKTIIPNNQSFLQTLRTKLLWGEDTRNETHL
ncbi:MAG: NAD kinase [Flavobacteriia bacterium]|nr:NAD kinase [Flavobacteriia bacterium]OIP47041.1 MAG: NAD kinase [Flavobacteriaceae bacterium CG2_30_31_66]PIV97772.1 MAG: NAD kinase [Flavobacteriaceae bacterium CG17_big_fil_post_rev_8_21_14_2_50_31_13]PIX12778.1 MAG: NAD kinase [Flavobacteriaceae bacterium CG_4_8_14_3_um_filter_31_8]PIY14509.1 MAG: NAD kinase [Flavobacteriaceae bacterium CG_4_10_14_3_um_filter_31_253]PIZ11883.1 MAG: NAD kinase [Flavobacteriaceae bacterium CG_4_10_14_0_8_um_filter_31_99]PJC10696.1 MAG: NAD kinase [Flavoba